MFFSIFFERREKENEKQHLNKIQRLRQIQILIKTSAHSSSIVLCINHHFSNKNHTFLRAIMNYQQIIKIC